MGHKTTTYERGLEVLKSQRGFVFTLKISMFLSVALPGVEFIYAYIWATATKVFSLCGFGFMWGPTINDQLALGILSSPSTPQKIVGSEVHGLFGAILPS